MRESRASLYSLLCGVAGGAAAWAGVEIVLWRSADFPDLRILTLALGAAAGLLLGAVVPLTEGLRQDQPRKVRTAILLGSALGLVFGALGMLAGQVMLSWTAGTAAISGAPLASRGAAMARIPGWAILGAAVGSASGIRSRSFGRIAAGAFGGLIGGLAGGLVSELVSLAIPRFGGRAVGMALWGVLVAVTADFMDRRRSRGRLTVLTGPLKGRSFPVNQRRLTIVRGRQGDLTLPGDSESAVDSGRSATVRLRKGTVVLEPDESADVAVNGERGGSRELRYDDVIRVDGVTMIYEAKK